MGLGLRDRIGIGRWVADLGLGLRVRVADLARAWDRGREACGEPG